MSMINTILVAEQAKLEEAKRIVEENGMTFIRESKKYAGKHPVIDSDAFQEYLIKECGGCCGDDCDGEYDDGDEGDVCDICGKPCKSKYNPLTGMRLCPDCEEEISES
jgi:hypothetical protein